MLLYRVYHLDKGLFIPDGLWYVFQTITTIGFGDVIAGVDYSGDWCEGQEIGFHFTNFFWVNIFLQFSSGHLAVYI